MNIKDNFLDDILLREMLEKDQWITQNSAILVFHGIGHQKPFETLDIFVRGMLDTYIKVGFNVKSFTLIHQLAKKDDGMGGYLYKNSDYYLDCYEFYWAPATENKVSWLDTKDWIHNFTNGAKKFYKNKKEEGEANHDESFFFSNGVFNVRRYIFIMNFTTLFVPMLGGIFTQLGRLIRYIPLIGDPIYNVFKFKESHFSDSLINRFGDIVAYNSPDPKNKLFKTRRTIQKKAYKAIRYLIEVENDKEFNQHFMYKYDNVLIVAHSLGSQIAFDALTAIDHRIALKEIQRENILNVLSGFVTFGSPLDKTAFFFSEQTEDESYIKAQIRNNFYCFKQKNSIHDKKYPFKVKNLLKSTLSSIEWRNYYDANDFTSGHLDYYANVTNINCDFMRNDNGKKNLFFYLRHLYPSTHNEYWKDNRMYTDIIVNYFARNEQT